MNRRNSKEENGITLLALSITIIILLILAADPHIFLNIPQ